MVSDLTIAHDPSSIRRFVVLTATGIVTFVRMRPIDQFGRLLRLFDPARDGLSRVVAGGAGGGGESGMLEGASRTAGTAGSANPLESAIKTMPSCEWREVDVTANSSPQPRAWHPATSVHMHCAGEEAMCALVGLACGSPDVLSLIPPSSTALGVFTSPTKLRATTGGGDAASPGWSPPVRSPGLATAAKSPFSPGGMSSTGARTGAPTASAALAGASLHADGLQYRAHRLFDMFGGSPSTNPRSFIADWERLVPSPRVGGVVLFFGRLMRPYWDRPAFLRAPVTLPSADGDTPRPALLLPTFSRDEMRALAAQLKVRQGR